MFKASKKINQLGKKTKDQLNKNFSKSYSQTIDRLSGHHRKQAYLILEDGSCFKGYSFGAPRSTKGEVVFTTGMVGYPENLTDPSYRGQIMTLTYPLIGNYGIPDDSVDELGLAKYFESDRIHVEGLIVQNYSEENSHYQATRTLEQWLVSQDIPALTGIDTRALTQKIRDRGVMLGKIVFEEDVSLENPMQKNLVAEVSPKTTKTFGKGKYKVLAVDCGMKNNIIRSLVNHGDATVKVVPWDYDVTQEDYDGLFLSNGPGDPSKCGVAIENIKKAYEVGKPIFGICLGNQLMAHAAGGKTYKLKYGNRGQNQPCVDLMTNKVYITPQNHGYAVDNQSLPTSWKPYFINVNDGSNEGIMHTTKPFFSVQFHPEAKSGPYDTSYLFHKFYNAIEQDKGGKVYMGEGRSPVKKVLLLGSGALQIGQAGEFDYSGSQAIKALKEEGVQVVLMNPNIATIQTAKDLADQVYFLPVTPEYVEEVIKKEKPDGVLLGFGGQTGLNCGVELEDTGIWKKYGVKVLGTSVDTIKKTEDRDLFKKALIEIGQPIMPSEACETWQESIAAANKIGYPVICRAAYSLGGLGSGFANNDEELKELVRKALSSSPQVLIEKSFKGWKECEYEVVRDVADNCITVCNMENFDPMGIHTGESIVVAPSQTLTNDEYHMLRTASIDTIRSLNIIGECNIQYTLDPHSNQYYVIEVNPRLSRSSALASKATGYPLAFVAAKLSLGIKLPEIRNSVTKSTSACFEPSLDYIVTKIPRWDISKFERVSPLLGSGMKSVGEVMAVGRSFEESMQKAMRMVDGRTEGFDYHVGATWTEEQLLNELTKPTPQRPFALKWALEKGYTVEQLHQLTKIDRWFLQKLERIHQISVELKQIGNLNNAPFGLLKAAKQAGFSDRQIAKLLNTGEMDVRRVRKSQGIIPVVKQIDTLAAEFPAMTNYLYMTYNGTYNDLPPGKGPVMVLGSGTYRIGSSVEFDYCSVMTIRALNRMGEKTVMINYNPETVSTDYDESDRLYFEELSLERVLDVHDHENPKGVIVSVGGQTPQNIALSLHKAGVNVLGTSPLMIDQAEDRDKYSSMLDRIGVKQPEWRTLTSLSEAHKFSERVGFPVLIRPSYVLSGAAMNVARTKGELDDYLKLAVDVSPEFPIVISKFVEGAREIEVDGVANKGKVVNWAVAEHIENAGVHSGDATHVLPTDGISEKSKKTVLEIASKIARELQISGPFNTQFLVKENEDYYAVIETNLRASRSFPFVSKTYDVDFIETATKVFMGQDVPVNPKCEREPKHVCVKCPQFSFQRLLGADPILGVEMASTGEVACFGDNKYEAFLKGMLSVPNNYRLPNKNKTIAVSGAIDQSFVPTVKDLVDQGYTIYGTPEVQDLLTKGGVKFTAVDYTPLIELMHEKKLDWLINIPDTYNENKNQYPLRRSSVDLGVPLTTNKEIAVFTTSALRRLKEGSISIKPKSYHEYDFNF